MSTRFAPEHWADVLTLPSAFDGYAQEPLVMRPAGSPDKTSLLKMRFEVIDGKTQMVENYGAHFQIARRIHHMDNELPDLGVVLIQSIGAGILQGDRVRTVIEVGDGARVTVTPQAATKLHEMEANYGSQRIDVVVGKNAYAEILMDTLIPCRGSRLYTELNFTVDPSSVLLWQDQIGAGRISYGELYDYEMLYTRMRCHRPDGQLISADTTVMSPPRTDPRRAALLGEGATDVGTMYLIAEAYEEKEALATAIHDRLMETEGLNASASVMPSKAGVHARMVSTDNRKVELGLHRAWEVARKEMLGVGVPRIYATKHGFSPEDLFA